MLSIAQLKEFTAKRLAEMLGLRCEEVGSAELVQIEAVLMRLQVTFKVRFLAKLSWLRLLQSGQQALGRATSTCSARRTCSLALRACTPLGLHALAHIACPVPAVGRSAGPDGVRWRSVAVRWGRN